MSRNPAHQPPSARATRYMNHMRFRAGNCDLRDMTPRDRLSNQGPGFMIMQIYAGFDTPSLYVLLIIVFVIAGLGNLTSARSPTRAREAQPATPSRFGHIFPFRRAWLRNFNQDAPEARA